MESSQKIKLPAILLIAPSLKISIALLEGLYKRSNNKLNEANFEKYKNDSSQNLSDRGYITSIYSLDTKYYNCNIALHLTTYDQIKLHLAEELQWSKYGLSSIEGVIFVADLTNEAREGVKEYIQNHNEIMEFTTPNISMAFVNKPSILNTDLNNILEFGEDDYLIEIIDDDLANLKQSPNSSGGIASEKYGIDRIVENFECHMWPNMMKKSQPKFDYSTKPSDEKNSNEEKSTDLNKKSDNKDVKQEVKNETSNSDLKENSTEKVFKNLIGFSDEDEDDEKEMDDLANIFQTIQNFKNTSQGLTDEQRREQAAKLIMRLVDNCKDMGEDDEEDEEYLDENKEKL